MNKIYLNQNLANRLKTNLSNVLITFVLFSSFLLNAQNNFVTTWDLSIAGSGSTQLSFGVGTTGIANYAWSGLPSGNNGFGNFTDTTLTITGLTPGDEITLQIGTTNFSRIKINYGADKNRLTNITQWGTTVWSSMGLSFNGCSNLNITATDIPNFSSVTNMASMFLDCYNLVTIPNINNWVTNNVTSMSSLFFNVGSFNDNIGNWNTGNVTSMLNMFKNDTLFNQDISNWNTGKVTDMSGMFFNTLNFNENINNWDTKNVIDMRSMFNTARNFNQPIGNWNTGKVTDMSGMFFKANAFNQNINNWNTEKVQYMFSMFFEAFNFNQPLGNWNTGKVLDMSNMFNSAPLFNQYIGNWNTEKVTNMRAMFFGVNHFNQNIKNWNIRLVTDMRLMFYNCTSFNKNLAEWGAKLNANVLLNNFLDFSGLNVTNYDSTLIAFNTYSPNGRTMGVQGLLYCSAVAERTNLVTPLGSGGKGWSIIGDATINPLAFLSPYGSVINPSFTCDYHLNPSNANNKLIAITPNGNTFNPTNITIENSGSLTASGVYSINGYYQIDNGTNTMRIGHRIISITAPGNYNVNGGVIVRIYYSPIDNMAISSDTPPSGSITEFGWFKSTINDASSIISSMQAGSPNLPSALQIIPNSLGTENGVNYAEFFLTSFSSIGFFSKTTLTPLPIQNSSIKIKNYKCTNALSINTSNNLSANTFLEFSNNGVNFYTLIKIDNKNLQIPTIQYTHNNISHTNYYRLKMVDNFQNTTFSKIEYIKPTSCSFSNSQINVYPNPTSSLLNIILAKETEKADIIITDATGKVVLNKNTNTSLTLNIAPLLSGVYTVHINTETETKNIKLIKQ